MHHAGVWVREQARIPEDKMLMFCVAPGWIDDAFPANAVVTSRRFVEDAVIFDGSSQSLASWRLRPCRL